MSKKITKKRITELVANHNFGDFISIDGLIKFTAEHYDELGFQFYWVEDNGIWAIAFNNRSKALKYGAIVFDWEVKFREGNYNENFDDLVDLLYCYADSSKYYNALKIEKRKKKVPRAKDNQVLADYMVRRFVDVVRDYKDIEFNQKSVLIARVQNLKI